MYDSFHSRRIFLHNFHSIFRRIPAVDDDGHLGFPRKFKLADKPLFLHAMALMIPVIVQSDLSDCDNLVEFQEALHPVHMFFCERAHLIRVYADGSPDKGILFRQFLYLLP